MFVHRVSRSKGRELRKRAGYSPESLNFLFKIVSMAFLKEHPVTGELIYELYFENQQDALWFILKEG